MDEILRQSLYALMERRGSTLLDLEPLLDRDNPAFRNQIIRTSNDEMTVRFFRDTYPGYPERCPHPYHTRINRIDPAEDYTRASLSAWIAHSISERQWMRGKLSYSTSQTGY